MKTERLDDLAARLAAPFKALPRADALLKLYPPTLALLARGRPVGPAELAAAVGRPVEEVLRDLRIQKSVEYTEEGEIAGFGLTLRETPHRVTLGGTTLFTWCALDTLMYPVILGRSFEVESPCHETGTLVRVRVSPQGVEVVSPPSAVVSIVVPDDVSDVRGSFCNDVHYFVSRDAASRWLDRHPEGLILPAAEAFALGALRIREIVGVPDSPRPEAGASADGVRGCCG